MLQRAEMSDPKYDIHDGDIHDRNLSPLLEPTRIPSLRTWLAAENVFKFCFVRHPATRVLSCYLNKIISDVRDDRLVAIILGLLGREEPPESALIGFSEFLQAIERQDAKDMDPHWRPQFSLLAPDIVSYDFVGRFENIAADICNVCVEIGISYQVYMTARRNYGTGADSRMGEFYGADEMDLLERIYADDFAVFGYGDSARSKRSRAPRTRPHDRGSVVAGASSGPA
jgi:hypothetical protein